MIFRAFGYLLLLAAIFAGAYDVVASIRAASVVVLATGDVWFELHAASLSWFQEAIQAENLPRWLEAASYAFFNWPAWLVLGTPGALLVLAFRRRRKGDSILKSLPGTAR